MESWLKERRCCACICCYGSGVDEKMIVKGIDGLPRSVIVSLTIKSSKEGEGKSKDDDGWVRALFFFF
jgi:hypothetical protein